MMFLSVRWLFLITEAQRRQRALCWGWVKRINHEIHEKGSVGVSPASSSKPCGRDARAPLLETKPTLANLLRVSKALGLDLGELLKSVGNEHSPKAIGWAEGPFLCIPLC